MKYKIKGWSGHGRLQLNSPEKIRKLFPMYFVVDIDTQTIKEREKER